MSKRNLLSEEYIKKLPKSVITSYEAKICRMFRTKSVERISEELGKKPTAIYGVFRTIRNRRRRHQTSVNFWNALARDKRLYHILTNKPPLPNEEDEY